MVQGRRGVTIQDRSPPTIKLASRIYLLNIDMATSTTAAPSIDDPNLHSAYTHFQEAMCGAYGMAGAGSLRRHFKQNASLADGAETIVVAGTNSREEVVRNLAK